MINSVIAIFSRLFPLKSGCGPFANSTLFRFLDPPGGKDSVVKLKGGRAVIPAGDYVGRAMRFAGDLDPKVSWVIERSLLPSWFIAGLEVDGELGGRVGEPRLHRDRCAVAQAEEVLVEPMPLTGLTSDQVP